MVVTEHEASTFIQGYTQLMLHIYGPLPTKPKMKLIAILAAARAKYVADRSLLDAALLELEAKSGSVAPEVISAVQSLEVKKWIYLKDTSAYSVFIDPSAKLAYGVLGLTQKIRSVLGGSGAVVETGLMRYAGRYVTDGIVSNVVWLGQNYRRSFTNELASLRAQGAFHKSYEP